MKCNQCGTENNLRERRAKQGRCKHCNHLFAFEPTSMGQTKFTDPFFAKAITDLASNRTLYFTPKQLLYFLDRRLKLNTGNTSGMLGNYLGLIFVAVFFFFLFRTAPPTVLWFLAIIMGLNPLGSLYQSLILSRSTRTSPRVRRSNAIALQCQGIFIMVVGILYSWFARTPVVYGAAALIGLSTLWLGFFQRRRSQEIPETFLISAKEMLGWLDRWSSINGAVDYLLPSPSSTLPASTPTPDPEVTAYSFDRLVVCQSDEIAQMLIANNFHFENNCAVLGISGYPQRIFETAMQMLRRNPDLRVFALHDCSPEGITLVHRLRTDSRWFPDESIAIVDVGLSPRQILAAKSDLFIQRSVSSAQAAQTLDRVIREKLAAAELAWLDIGNYVELESFTPQKLLQVLRWTIANSQQLDTVEEDSSLLAVGTGVGLFYAMESFG
jgi:hypothetical protein